MKALEILNKINEQIKVSRDDGFAVEIHFNRDYTAEIERAIEELEYLHNEKKSLVKILEKMNEEMIDLRKENLVLKSRSCATCKYNKEQDNFMIFCDKEMCQDGSKMMWHSFTKDFYCKYWELKNERD